MKTRSQHTTANILIMGPAVAFKNHLLLPRPVTFLLSLLLLANLQFSNATSEETSRAGQEIDESDDIESQMPLVPSDDVEVGSLVGNEQLFSDYCLQSRDIILGDVKRSVSDLVNSLFSLFFRSFELLNIDRSKIDKASKRDLDNFEVKSIPLKSSGASQKPFKLTTKPEIPVLGGPKAGRGGDGKGIGAHLSNFPLFRAIWGAISGIKNAIAATVMKKLDSLRRMFGLDKLAWAMGGACEKIFSYDDDLRLRFGETKQQLVEMDPNIESVEFIQLNCVTIRRVMRLKGVCGFTRHLQNPLVKMLLGDGAELSGTHNSDEWDEPLGMDR